MVLSPTVNSLNFLRDTMAQILGQMGETVFDPLRDPVSSIGHQHGPQKQSQHERDQGVSGEKNPVPDFRRSG